MLYRRFIRGLLLSVWIVCVGVWVGSYVRSYRMAVSDGVDRIIFQSDWGRAVLTTGGSANTYYVGYLGKAGSGFDENYYGMKGIHLLGFALGPIENLWGATVGHYLMFPLWFPALISTVVLWLKRGIVVAPVECGGFLVETRAKPT